MSRDLPEFLQNTMKYFGTEVKENTRKQIKDWKHIRPTVFGEKPIHYEKQVDPFVKESAVKCIVYVRFLILFHSVRIRKKFV